MPFKKDLRYKIVAVGFIIGLALLILPTPSIEEIEFLPETGEEAQLSIEITVDKNDIQRDDPSEKRFP